MLKLVTAATSMPVTRDQFKKAQRVVDDDENEVIDLYLGAAAEFVADRCQLVLAPAVYRVERSDFWSGCFQILVAPVREIGSVKYFDADNSLQTVPEDSYGWRRTPEGATIEFLSGYQIPAVRADRHDAVQIEVLAGFENPAATGSGTDPEIVLPLRARQCVQLIAAHWYEHREAADPTAFHTLPLGAESIMGQLRIYR